LKRSIVSHCVLQAGWLHVNGEKIRSERRVYEREIVTIEFIAANCSVRANIADVIEGMASANCDGNITAWGFFRLA
jgi:hypothetical protein